MQDRMMVDQGAAGLADFVSLEDECEHWIRRGILIISAGFVFQFS